MLGKCWANPFVYCTVPPQVLCHGLFTLFTFHFMQHFNITKTFKRCHIPSPDYRTASAVNSERISNPTCFDQLQNPWCDGVPEQGLSSHQTAKPDPRHPPFPPHHVPSLDCHQHQHQHQHGRQLNHPSLLARHVGPPLALLPRGARQAPQEAPPPVAVHPRG